VQLKPIVIWLFYVYRIQGLQVGVDWASWTVVELFVLVVRRIDEKTTNEEEVVQRDFVSRMMPIERRLVTEM